MNRYKDRLPQELEEYYNGINETIRVIPYGKHVTKENLEEKAVDIVLQTGYTVNEHGLIIMKEPGSIEQEHC